MGFLIKRYMSSIRTRGLWLLLAIVPPLLYLGLAYSRIDRYTVRQDVGISMDAPMTVATSPVDFVRMSDLLAKPTELFMDRLALRELYGRVHPGASIDLSGPQYEALLRAVDASMSLTALPKAGVRIAYHGENPETGGTLVEFFSSRLIKRAEEGVRRSHLAASRTMKKAGEPGGAGSQGPDAPARLMGTMVTEAHRAMWRPERLSPLVQIAIISLVAVLVLLGILEWADTSFKSERQVARYLGAPVLGSLPNLRKVSKTLGAWRRE
jgi:hypothetical protein